MRIIDPADIDKIIDKSDKNLDGIIISFKEFKNEIKPQYVQKPP